MLTPFDRLDGYERRVQNGDAAPAGQAGPSSSLPAAGATSSTNMPLGLTHFPIGLSIMCWLDDIHR